MPKLLEARGGAKTKDLLSKNCMSEMRPCSTVDRQIGSKFGKQAKPIDYFEKTICISYQYRSEVQTYGHRPPDTTDNDAAETDMCAQKFQVATASTIQEKNILFRINWRRVIQGLNVGPIGRSPFGVRSGDLESQATVPLRPIQRSLLSGGEMLILKRILLLVLLRQQQQSGSNLAFLSAFVSLYCIAVGCVSVGGRTFEHLL